MPKDYGYFGKGSSGYAHYQQTFNGDNGCLEVIGILVVVIAVVLIVLQVFN